MGYAGTTRFRPKAAYETTVETTIYCAPEAVGKGIGSGCTAELFEVLRGEDIHRFVAGYALPNAATEALHRRFGFKVVGVFSENGRKFGKYWDVCWLERAGTETDSARRRGIGSYSSSFDDGEVKMDDSGLPS